MGLTYNSGPYRETTGIPASAFSAGDLLIFTSASSLSRMPDPMVSGTQIAGVALADSIQSLNDQVPYVEALPETVFWSTCTAGSQFTPGSNYDIVYDSPTFVLDTSQLTACAVIREPSDLVVGSNESRVLVSLIGNAGGLEYA